MIHEQEFTYRIEEALIMVDVERPLRTILSRSDAPKGKIRLAILCSILNKIWDLAPPLLIGVAVDVVVQKEDSLLAQWGICLLYTSPSPRDQRGSRMPSSA